MAATYTFDVFCSLDGFGSYESPGDWGGYWGKQGPEFRDRRLAVLAEEQRMVLGAHTFRRRRRRRRPAQAGVGGAVALPRKPGDEPRADGGTDPIFAGTADFDLELLESRTLDGNTQELIYRPSLHN